jgi:hypothetical protein
MAIDRKGITKRDLTILIGEALHVASVACMLASMFWVREAPWWHRTVEHQSEQQAAGSSNSETQPMGQSSASSSQEPLAKRSKLVRRLGDSRAVLG